MGPRNIFASLGVPAWRRNENKRAAAHLVSYNAAACRRTWKRPPVWSEPVALTQHGQPFGRVCEVCLEIQRAGRVGYAADALGAGGGR